MSESDKKTYIAEEAFVVLHSGEIPEVTYHESIYYLTEDVEGPGLQLNIDDVFSLKQAVIKRYRAIILRDIDPGNRDKGLYRGMVRCVANWQRLLKFCTREKMDVSVIRVETAEALIKFLCNEFNEVQSGSRSSSINCSQAEIEELAISLGVSLDDLPERWRELCPTA